MEFKITLGTESKQKFIYANYKAYFSEWNLADDLIPHKQLDKKKANKPFFTSFLLYN